MFQLINIIILEFQSCFKRIKTWQCFVVLMLGFMISREHRGVTSVISALKLNPNLYHRMLHFFRSTGYKIETLYGKWIKIAIKRGTIKRM